MINGFIGLTVFLTLLVAVSDWFYSQGRLNITYPLSIVKYVGFMFIWISIALLDPTKKIVLLFLTNNIWGLVMSIKGLWRLHEEKQIKKRKPERTFLKD